MAQKILDTLGEPLAVGSHLLEVTVSIGIALFEAESEAGLQDIMKQADLAMYAAKQAGRNCYRYYGSR